MFAFISTHLLRRPMIGQFSDEQYEGRVLEDFMGDNSTNGKKKATPVRPAAALSWHVNVVAEGSATSASEAGRQGPCSSGHAP